VAQLVFVALWVLLTLFGVGIFLWVGSYYLLTAVGAPSDLPDQILGVVMAVSLIALCLAIVGYLALIPFGDRAFTRGVGVLGRVIAVTFCAFWVFMASFLSYHAVVDPGTPMWQRAFYVVAGWGLAGAVLWSVLRPRKTHSPT
jgi:hypothetical protein